MNDALLRLTDWLLSDAVLHDLPLGGSGIVNWRDAAGLHDGLYPEIGGYYLQFLALAARTAPALKDNPGSVPEARARDAAGRVLAWLDRTGPAGDPLTLQNRDPSESDWRNHCLFAFDLAIILRGFASIEARWPELMPDGLRARYINRVRTLVEGRRLVSHRLRDGAPAHEVPAKWSTLTGVHHVKAAAALAGLDDPHLLDIASVTLGEEAEALDREGLARMRELHPFLYLIEGWLTRWGQGGNPDCLARAGAAFRMLLTELNPEQGVLPPIAGRPDLAVRADVLAQALRAGLVLEAASSFDAAERLQWAQARARLLVQLLQRITPEGGVEFDRIGRHRNVWASLFAWQALLLQAQAEAGTLIAREMAAVLI